MKIFTSLFLATLLVGCATNPQVSNIQTVAKQTFGSDTNPIIHEIIPPHIYNIDPYDNDASIFNLDLRYDLLLGETQNVDLVVWSTSSDLTARGLLTALQYTKAHRLSHLRLLFVGDTQDAERVRLTVEASGAKFYFHQR